jgi:hypothetical protein
MGIDDRDYMRDRYRKRRGLGGPWHKLPRCRTGLYTHFPIAKQSLTPLPPTITRPRE